LYEYVKNNCVNRIDFEGRDIYPDGTTYTYTYDPAGNRTQDKDRTYTYNSLNQLISASDGTSYTRNGKLIVKDKIRKGGIRRV